MKERIKKGLRKAVLPVLGLAALVNTGCQTAQIDYINYPKSSSAMTERAGKAQNCLDANTPRTFSETFNRIGDNIGGIFGDISFLGTRPFALLGMDFANNRYFGQGDFKEGIFSDNENYFYKQQAFADGKNKFKSTIFHPVNWSVSILRGVGDLLGHGINLGGQIVNLPILLMTFNANERDEVLNREKKDTSLDSIYLSADAITDPIKQPIRTLIYTLTESNFPSSISYGYGKMQEAFGYRDNNDNGRKMKRLRYSLLDEDFEMDSQRVLANLTPLAPILDKQWNTTWRDYGKQGYVQPVATSISSSIECGKINPPYARKIYKLEEAGAGVFRMDREGNCRFYPNEETNLALMRSVFGVGKYFIGFLRGESGGGYGSSEGGISGGEGSSSIGAK